ncbi:hypothetical protein LCGC14_2151300, partial [marine sediment metagenome]
IRRGKKPSPPGSPVRTRRGKAKRADAILYDVDRRRKRAIVGFTHAVLGESMSGHERGGKYMGTKFPQRPTMGPALKANRVRFANEFRGSLGR